MKELSNNNDRLFFCEENEKKGIIEPLKSSCTNSWSANKQNNQSQLRIRKRSNPKIVLFLIFCVFFLMFSSCRCLLKCYFFSLPIEMPIGEEVWIQIQGIGEPALMSFCPPAEERDASWCATIDAAAAAMLRMGSGMTRVGLNLVGIRPGRFRCSRWTWRRTVLFRVKVLGQ